MENQQNQEKIGINSLQDVLNSSSKSQEKQFILQNICLKHQNHIEVLTLEQPVADLTVTNYFWHQDKNNLIKVIEIKFKDRLIRMTDSFLAEDCCQLSHKQIEYSQMRLKANRLQLLKKKFKKNEHIGRRDIKNGQARDTKNVVKNIVNLFVSWLNNTSEKNKTAKCHMKKISKNQKFNNSLIIQISQDENTRKAFIEFTQLEAEFMIMKSKIKDKQSHIEALQKYYSICCQQGELSEEINPKAYYSMPDNQNEISLQ